MKPPIIIISYANKQSIFSYADGDSQTIPIFKNPTTAIKYCKRLEKALNEKFKTLVVSNNLNEFFTTISKYCKNAIIDPPPIPLSIEEIGTPGTLIELTNLIS
jgi:hypothetical protein